MGARRSNQSLWVSNKKQVLKAGESRFDPPNLQCLEMNEISPHCGTYQERGSSNRQVSLSMSSSMVVRVL